MAIVAGIDEAGYGPLLGPLVVSATAFRVRERDADGDLWELLAPVVKRTGRGSPKGLVVADSKRVFSRKAGIASLERNLLPFAAMSGSLPGNLRELIAGVGSGGLSIDSQYPWYGPSDLAIPRDVKPADVLEDAARLREKLAAVGAALCRGGCEVVDVGTFNREVRRCGNKSVVAARRVSALMRTVWEEAGDEPIRLVVDRQGGRKMYGTFLRATFPECRVITHEEHADRSVYEVTGGTRWLAVSFEVKADQRHLPTALASMWSKYVRELFVEMLNGFWQQRVPGLCPTAGYVTDGRRFIEEIDAARRAEGIAMGLLVRQR